MRNPLPWLATLLLLGAITALYWQNRPTTYRTADGACQSLTVEDECE
ncbi:hypothetical protein JCM19379_21910 [Methyloparacoccus murrellii]